MATSASAPSASPTDDGGARWEISRQWRLAWRTIKWTALGGLVAAALLVVGQVYLFGRLFADVHPWLGYAFVGLVTLAFVWLIALPIARFVRMPTVARPPDIDLDQGEITAKDVMRRMRFDRAYLKGLRRNPELAGEREAIDKALADLDMVLIDAHALATFEHSRIEPLLAPLDRAIDRYIHAEASAVGAATAISMNGSLDAFIVLWRNANMVARVARIYYGRPSLRASAFVLRDVSGAVVLSGALDSVTDMAGDALSGVLGKLGGMVAGPLMDGSINALVTLKVGYLAKQRCRSFEAWSPKRKANIVFEVIEQLRSESVSMTGELVKRCGGLADAAANAGAKAFGLPRSAWEQVRELVARKLPAGTRLPGGAEES